MHTNTENQDFPPCDYSASLVFLIIMTLPASVPQVKKRVVQVISAMAHHGYLELEGGELLVRFIVQHCALHDTYQV